MGRPPIGKRAMTSAERQRRFLARIREQASAQPAPAPKSSVALDGATIRVRHLAMDPIRIAQWLRKELGNRATRALIDGLAQALADPTITSGRDE